MPKNMLKNFILLIAVLCSVKVHAAKKPTASFKYSKTSSKKSYSTKSPYAGLGKKSMTNGKIKTKSVSGYFKPSNGYKFVHSYSRT